MSKFGLMKDRFQLGQIVATPASLERAERFQIDLGALLRRHVAGDWGDLDGHDVRVNEEALRSGARLLSSYGAGESKIWIITDAAWDDGFRRSTTILRPEDY